MANNRQLEWKIIAKILNKANLTSLENFYVHGIFIGQVVVTNETIQVQILFTWQFVTISLN